MDEMKLFVPITKVDVAQRLVYGTIAHEVADKSGEIMDYATAKPQFESWSAEIGKASDGKSVGNIRAMHGSVAAGKLTSIAFDDAEKRIEACGKIVDDGEWNKVLEGVYTGFSMGGKYLKRWKDADAPHLTRYTPSVAEVSIVDNPCIPTATFEVIKADGTTEMRKFHTPDAPAQPEPTNVAPDVEQGWKAKDGSFHATKAAALKKNSDIDAEAAAKTVAAPAQSALEKLDAALKASVAAPEATPAAEPMVHSTLEEPKADKATRAEALRKGLYDVSRLACILDDLKWMQQGLASEATWEGDNSPAPEALQTLVEQLGRFLVALATEETSELSKPDAEDYDGDEYDIIELAAKALGVPRTEAIAKALPDGALKRALAKAGARHSKTDQSRVQRAHDMAKDSHDNAVDLGADCNCGAGAASGDDAGKHVHADDLAKVSGENAALRKVLDELAPKIDAAVVKIEEQGKEIERLNAQPMPGGAYRTVTKGADAAGDGADGDPVKAFQKHLATLPDNQRALALMKMSLAQPMATAPEPVGTRA